MAKSVWEEATPEARAALQNIKQYVGATPGKRTGPGSPGYIAPRGLTPKRQASVGRRLAAQTQTNISKRNRQTQLDLQQNRFAQEDKTFARKLAEGNFGQRPLSRRGSVSGKTSDAWKYGGTSDITGLPTHRTNASGMQKYIPEETDKKTGVTTPGYFGETIGGANVPNALEEGTGTVLGRLGSPEYSQNIFQRKEQRPDGSDRFVFTNVGSHNLARGDQEITDSEGNYARSRMVLGDNDAEATSFIEGIERASNTGKGPAAELVTPPVTKPASSLSEANYMPPTEGLANVEGQFQDTPLYKLGEGAVDLTKQIGSDLLKQYSPQKHEKTIPQLRTQGGMIEPSVLTPQKDDALVKQIMSQYLGEDPLSSALNGNAGTSVARNQIQTDQMIKQIQGTKSRMEALGIMNSIKDPEQRAKFISLIEEKYAKI